MKTGKCYSFTDNKADTGNRDKPGDTGNGVINGRTDAGMLFVDICKDC